MIKSNWIILFIFLTSCKVAEYGQAIKDEKVMMEIKEERDIISYSNVKPQIVPKFAERTDNTRGAIFVPLLGTAVSLASDAVKQMIANDRKKYMAYYDFALTDLYFYDQLSTESVFDPVGMQFSGFRLIRTFLNKKGKLDTALQARFVLDTSKVSEIINNSIFRLRLESLDIRYTKAKVTGGQKNILNMDIEISFRTSYVNELGNLFDNIELGKFYCILRDMPLDKSSENYSRYYDSLKNKLIDGKSFIVPRSYGYYMSEDNTPKRAFSQGAYSIQVKVKESTLDKFITKVIIDNSDEVIESIESKTKGYLKKL